MFGVVNLREIKLYKLKCQRIINYSENTKYLHNRKKSSKKSEFLKFYLYFCHVIQSFIIFFCNTKISEISDMTKP